jgi:hypothetical protein
MLVWNVWYISSHSSDVCSLTEYIEIWQNFWINFWKMCLPGNVNWFVWQASSRNFCWNCSDSLTGFTAYREYILQTPWCAERLGLHNGNCMLKRSICLGYGYMEKILHKKTPHFMKVMYINRINREEKMIQIMWHTMFVTSLHTVMSWSSKFIWSCK